MQTTVLSKVLLTGGLNLWHHLGFGQLFFLARIWALFGTQVKQTNPPSLYPKVWNPSGGTCLATASLRDRTWCGHPAGRFFQHHSTTASEINLSTCSPCHILGPIDIGWRITIWLQSLQHTTGTVEIRMVLKTWQRDHANQKVNQLTHPTLSTKDSNWFKPRICYSILKGMYDDIVRTVYIQ